MCAFRPFHHSIFGKRSELTTHSERFTILFWKTLRINDAFRTFHYSILANAPNQQAIQTVSLFYFGKRSELTTHSERLTIRIWKTVRITDAFRPFDHSNLENAPN
ncbi:hypothetical protein ACM26V_12040 [Salipaludibacillus sp. HK11]|uniref:hypothetical protein n=1 Tax=Salipaludibacillus sp. HK11 TaxID=3394320 RepID=UPI0039FCFBBC